MLFYVIISHSIILIKGSGLKREMRKKLTKNKEKKSQRKSSDFSRVTNPTRSFLTILICSTGVN